MDTRKALKIAIAALEDQIKPLNIDANLLDKMGFRTQSTIKASRRRAELRETIEALERIQFGGAHATRARRSPGLVVSAVPGGEAS